MSTARAAGRRLSSLTTSEERRGSPRVRGQPDYPQFSVKIARLQVRRASLASMVGFVELLLMMLIMAVVFFGILWLIVRSAVRAGARAAREVDRDEGLPRR